ncbi:lysine exporter LysO family protein [Halodesulfovibrio spirochaetisodalis]|uniref:Membrane protein n=1 Tax=Halodesulfovibrio spirochaetisodalis TaxID=1560234 RepID=A0A1B7X955_9BACT|nr:lysine exporter LysO family protein [Halodesulfovibrio spirochaetisodalis]OBQ45904.1 membrane protein [Halodesulfovibrio spirochaetisodalis]
MKGSLIILSFFIAGCLVGHMESVPSWLLNDALSTYTLYALLFLVGMSIGFDSHCWQILRQLHLKVLLVPTAIVIGTAAGSVAAWCLIADMPLRDVFAVGAGFGYYSLSTVIITNMGDPILGSVALLSNIIREILTLLGTPLLVRFFGKLAPVASGGATAMDTTLPIIVKFTSERYGIIAVFSGMVLTVLVPFLVTFIMT